MGLFRSIRGYVDALVHPSAMNDALAMARHRAFIAPRLIGSSVALASFPAYIVVRGVPSVLEFIVFSWLIAPILTAYFLSRTGRYEGAHILSCVALTVLVTIIAVETGGIGSFAAIWLVIVPLEAALSASRRVVAIASTLAFLVAGSLMICDIYQLLPAPAPEEQRQGALAALGIISAALYATGLALGAESLARTSFWLRYAEEDRYRLLAHNMTDVITRHASNGSVLFASPAAESLFGAPVLDLQGHGLFDRVHVADRPAYLTALGDALELGDARSVEFRVRKEFKEADGRTVVRFVWVEMRCRPLDRAAGGELDSENREIVAVMRDITDRKSQEHALEDARAEAERANAAKGRFLATMSHELRTPLNVIIGFSEMLQHEKDMQIDSTRRSDYAKLINESGHHLLSVVNGILDMSKIDTGEFEIQPEPFELPGVIASCCALFQLKSIETGVNVKYELATDLPEINADQRSLKQILINLLSNAMKFTNSGGLVTVKAHADTTSVYIDVEDNGIGVSAEDLPRLGNPFFQARGSYDRRHDGTGLGLSIVRGLVELHAGEMSLRSKLGEGTCVTIRLPIDCEIARRAKAPANNVHPVPVVAAPVEPGRIKLPTPDDDVEVRISA